VSWHPLVLSFEVALLASIICTLLGIAVGVALAHPKTPFRDVLDVFFTAPLVLPPTVLGYYVLVALGRRSAIGMAYEHVTGSSIVFTKTGAVVAAAVGALPLVVKAARSSLEGIEPTLVDAARTLGARPLRIFFTVRFPLAARGIVAGVMLAFARSLGDFGVTLMVAGDIPGETQTASLAIYDAIQAQRDDEALSLILVLSVVAFVALYVVNKLSAKAHVA
jgi:molybdate transport system permease protein